MYKRPTAIVIGAGLSGIATAARLVHSGYDVTVLEKNAAPGGRCSQLLRDGHRFDIGPTLFLMPEVFAQTYAALGEDMRDHLNLKRVDPAFHIHFDDHTQLSLTSNLNAMQAQLEAIEPGSFGGFLRYLAEGEQNCQGSLRDFVGQNFHNLFDYFCPQNLPLLFKLKTLIKHYNHIGRYFEDPRLKAAFTFQDMYMGLSPFDALATYSLIQYSELVDGVWFPLGGMYGAVTSLASIAEQQGVQFVYNMPVKRIDVSYRRASAVITEDERRWSADVIIANADTPYVYSYLLPGKTDVDHRDQLKYTSSAVVFYWGVDKVYPTLGTHNVFLSGDHRGSYERIFVDNTLPETPSFYVHAPARIDPSAAPEGQDTLTVLVPTGHLNHATALDWETLREQARAAVLKRLASQGITDLENHLKFEVSYAPHTWLTRYGMAKDAAFGLRHLPARAGYVHLSNRATIAPVDYSSPRPPFQP